MTCKNCNAPLEEQARFCVKCGKPVADSQSQAPQAGPQDATKIVLQPKKVDNPIRPPKRPTLVQQHRQDGDGPKAENKWPTLTPETGEDAIPAAASSRHDFVDEQVTSLLTPDMDSTGTSISAGSNTFYGQPTVVVIPDDGRDTPPYNVPTVPFELPRTPHPELADAGEAAKGEGKGVVSSPEQPQPLLYYQLNTTAKGLQKLPAVVNRTGYYNQRRRRGCGGCILSGLSTLIVLILVVGALWVFALRPYAHNIAQRELDNALASAVNQMPAQAAQLPAGSVIPVNEDTINNLIVLNLAPSNPVQHPTTTITGQNIRLDFQLYNFPCAITMVPALNNGRLVMNNVGVEGIFSAIMSPEEMTSILNKHLNDAQTKLQRTVNNVQLKNHEVDLTMG